MRKRGSCHGDDQEDLAEAFPESIEKEMAAAMLAGFAAQVKGF